MFGPNWSYKNLDDDFYRGDTSRPQTLTLTARTNEH